MGFRVTTLNLEQDHKRWDERRELIVEELGGLKPDVFAINEICLPRQTGRYLQHAAKEHCGLEYNLIQQSKVNGLSVVDGEGLLTRFPVRETANLDYRARDAVALVARVEIDDRLVDLYVTHLYRSEGEDSLRLYQVEQLLDWVSSRNHVDARVVCGDFNATLDMASAALMAAHFRPTQTEPTAFTPLQEKNGTSSHPKWERFDRCIDYIWVAGPLRVKDSGVCFNKPSPEDYSLWPSDHMGVWADLEFE